MIWIRRPGARAGLQEILNEALFHGDRRKEKRGSPPVPGRPSGILVATAREIARPHDFSLPHGRLRLLHAVAQIELSAIELALDSSYSFPEAPFPFHRDMLAVAAQEAEHFGSLRRRLLELGGRFGDFPIHTHLWEQAHQAEGLLQRMAIVPRILEARGLDATPGLIRRFQGVGDVKTAALLERIYREEVGHVATGSHWFHRFASERSLDPQGSFVEIVERFHQRNGRGRFAPNLETRREAGFSDRELSPRR